MMAMGVLQVVSEGDLQAAEAEAAELERGAVNDEMATDRLAHHVRQQWQRFRNHRNSEGIDRDQLNALRQYNGEYQPDKLRDIKAFGGSDVFARMTSIKCRGATALLRDVFLGAERTWGIGPTPVPDLPDDIMGNIDQLVMMESLAMQQAGVAIDSMQVEQRRQQLMEAAARANIKRANDEARESEQYIQDFLVEGGFYEAMIDFLINLPIFRFAALKGPVVQMVQDVTWQDGQAVVADQPKMHWYAPNPMDLYFTPGATKIENADVIEKIKLTRAELNSLIGLPGYDEEAIRNVLNDYDRGLVDFLDGIDSERASTEHKENPNQNESELIDGVEYHGCVKGSLLRDYGFLEGQVPDTDRDYMVTAWVIGRYTIKVQINPNPRQRHPYYITSYEKVPSSLYGRGVPFIVEDVQDVANACFRSLVNNMSISSGPQVSINEDRLSPATNPDTMYPWKRWRFLTDPMQTNAAEKPIDFFQPQSNATELLGVYQKMMDIADEVSGIPRYITGSEKVGGAASTASGLSMLMNNASKVMQQVASNVDKDIMQPLLQQLYDMILLTDGSGVLKGDENIVVKGVTVAMQKEQDRMRKLEFLQITGNPIDMQIIGIEGRAKVLKDISDDLGMHGESIVPSAAELEAKRQAEQQQQMLMQQAAAQAQGGQPPAPQQGRLAAPTDNAQRTRNLAGGGRPNMGQRSPTA